MIWIPAIILPEYKTFIGRLEDGSIHVFTHEDDFGYYYTGGWEGCSYCGGKSVALFKRTEEIHNRYPLITHWMNLPEPPKEII